jgi:uncharacterized protein (TIGR02646 family)
MLHVEPPPAPPGLSTAKAEAERAALHAYYAIAANKNLPYAKGFHAYQADGVREALTAAFHGKCAYCETYYAATQPSDVEHFRPKGGVTIVGSKPVPPGYWWLASDWLNLLPSCIDCNRPRKQDFPAGMPKTAGKANRFPIGSERSRRFDPGAEAKERRLLLHPYLDDPEKHLRFVAGTDSIRDGEIEPTRSRSGRADRQGATSIEVYALQRRGLVEKRGAVVRKLLGHLTAVKNLMEAAERHPGDQSLLDSFRAAVKDVALYIAPDQEYAAMCRQIVAEYSAGMFRSQIP